MSSYRDDTQETAVASDFTWGQLTTIAEETVKFTSTLLVGIFLMLSDVAIASDEVIDRSRNMTTEYAVISDTVFDLKRTAILVTESTKITDTALGALQVLHVEQATASDAVIDNVRSVTTDSAQVTDQVIATRFARTLVTESAKLSDTTLQAASVLVTESVTALDWSGGKLRSKTLSLDSATIADQVIDAHKSPSIVIESARIDSSVTDHLLAQNLIVEQAVVEDEQIGGGNLGQAWTANADTWAMSRYAPYTFNSLSVVDGVLYGLTEDGVYALDSEAQQISGAITTGKLDLGNGSLVHPLGAYVEYELFGNSERLAQMDVTTTQSGAAQTYTYTLPTERADELTNGRFVFGRGLRGRHFTFSLHLTGQRGYINDLSVELAQTKRRV